MERLTKRELLAGHYVAFVSDEDCFDMWSVPKKFMGNAIDRLAAIEDILGDTYDLDRLRELVEADKDGRCAVLPVKPGDTIYQIGHKEIIPFRVGNVAVEEWGLSFEGYLEGFGVHRTMPGEKVFFTIEEANEVLERILSKGKQDGQKESSQD